jgi:peptidoglycan hydrolase-like protein with peptidoglycan-binding domain
MAQQRIKNTPPDLGGVLHRQSEARQSVEPAGVPAIVSDVLRTSGQPLETGTRNSMESRFSRSFSPLPLHGAPAETTHDRLAVGPPTDRLEDEAERTAERAVHSSADLTPGHRKHDFSHVKVHTDRRAAESAQLLDARAYTVGRHIVFGEGEYKPESSSGRQLLAHELTHTLQQAAPRGAPMARIQRSLASTPPGKQTLRRGARGPAVRALQEKLLAFGYKLPRFGVDGIFGPETEAAVRQFQEDAGATLVDGIFGPETRRLLDQRAARQEGQGGGNSSIPHANSGTANESKVKSKDRISNPDTSHAGTENRNSLLPLVGTEQDKQDKTVVRPVPFAVEGKQKLHEVVFRTFRDGLYVTLTYSLFGATNLGMKDALLTFSKDSVSFGFDGKKISVSGVAQGGERVKFSSPVGKAQEIGIEFPMFGGVRLLYATKSVPFRYARKGLQVELRLSAELDIEIIDMKGSLFPLPEGLRQPKGPPHIPVLPVVGAQALVEILEALGIAIAL